MTPAIDHPIVAMTSLGWRSAHLPAEHYAPPIWPVRWELSYIISQRTPRFGLDTDLAYSAEAMKIVRRWFFSISLNTWGIIRKFADVVDVLSIWLKIGLSVDVKDRCEFSDRLSGIRFSQLFQDVVDKKWTVRAGRLFSNLLRFRRIWICFNTDRTQILKESRFIFFLYETIFYWVHEIIWDWCSD